MSDTDAGSTVNPDHPAGQAGAGVQVLDHRPNMWFLLKAGDALFLDAACNHGAFGYSWLIELDPGERQGFEQGGRAYLDRLAQDIHDGVPILANSTSPYKGRNRDRDLAEQVTNAVLDWRAASTAAASKPTAD